MRERGESEREGQTTIHSNAMSGYEWVVVWIVLLFITFIDFASYVLSRRVDGDSLAPLYVLYDALKCTQTFHSFRNGIGAIL